MSEFFGTLPEVGAALWEFGEGVYGLAIMFGSIALFALFAFLAKIWRDGHSWLSALSGVMAASIAFWWAFGILPSAQTFFLDGERDLLAGTIIPESLPGMDNFYQVFRDVLAVGQQTVFGVAFAVALLVLQRRYPRSLAEGEEKSPATGGYR